MLPRFTLVSLVVAALLLAPVQVPTAMAGRELPFDVVFPQDPVVTQFQNTWGHPRSGGRRHRGTDLMAPKMTEVYAMADGVVVHVRESRLAGRYLVIDHGEGWTTWYMHLNNDRPGTNGNNAPWFMTVAPGVGEGVQVRAGQLIAWSGNSGNAETSAPHTHFELQYGSRHLNPYPYLLAAHQRGLEAAAAIRVSPEDGLVLGPHPGLDGDPMFYIV
jgi:murein DD-endopeptidase MepM/ murein hydrolase activator NlpD